MLKFKKLIAFAVCFATLICCGCKHNSGGNTSSKTNATTESSVGNELNLLYSNKDTLNPYTCVTLQNRVLTQLMYEGLVILKNNYETEYNIAQKVSIENKKVLITLKNITFSDGSTLTADDVVFSFNLAKKSTLYGSSLKYAESATSTGKDTLTVSLTRNDLYFSKLLTFPIIKSGSDTVTDSDKRLLPPIGSGRFVYDVDEKVLKANSAYHKGKQKISKINLTDSPDEESANQTLSIGAIDYYFTDLANNVIPKMNGTVVDLPQNRVVFLGVNPQNAMLNNAYFRQAISASINRSDICNSAYFSKATPATGPFPPSWSEVSNLQSINIKPDLTTVQMNVKEAGFGEKNQSGFYVSKNNKPITFTLLVSSDNSSRLAAANEIKNNLENAGFKIKLVSTEFKNFKTELSAGRYDLYLGEISFHSNLDLGPLVKINSADAFLANQTSDNSGSSSSASSTSSTASTASKKPIQSSSEASQSTSSEEVTESLSTEEIYNGFYSGAYTVKDLVSVFNAELPVIPICFRQGLVIYSEKLGTGISPTVSDLFYNIENIK